MIDWTTVVSAVGGSAVTVGIVGWLLRALLSNQFARDLDRYRAELARTNQEAGIRYSRLHEKRADAILVLYQHFVTIQAIVSTLRSEQAVADTERHRRSLDKITEEWLAAGIYFKKHALFFDDELKKRIEAYLLGSFRFSWMIDYVGDFIDSLEEQSEDRKKKIREVVLAGLADAHTKVGPLVSDLEVEFRKILGG